MFGAFSHLPFTPCPECGASLAPAQLHEHECEPERWLDHQMLQCREEIERFEGVVVTYLDSPRGRFELWYAARQREAA